MDKSNLKVKKDRIGAQDQWSNQCPECKQPLGQNDVLCVYCGYNIETGKKVKPKRSFSFNFNPMPLLSFVGQGLIVVLILYGVLYSPFALDLPKTHHLLNSIFDTEKNSEQYTKLQNTIENVPVLGDIISEQIKEPTLQDAFNDVLQAQELLKTHEFKKACKLLRKTYASFPQLVSARRLYEIIEVWNTLDLSDSGNYRMLDALIFSASKENIALSIDSKSVGKLYNQVVSVEDPLNFASLLKVIEVNGFTIKRISPPNIENTFIFILSNEEEQYLAASVNFLQSQKAQDELISFRANHDLEPHTAGMLTSLISLERRRQAIKDLNDALKENAGKAKIAAEKHRVDSMLSTSGMKGSEQIPLRDQIKEIFKPTHLTYEELIRELSFNNSSLLSLQIKSALSKHHYLEASVLLGKIIREYKELQRIQKGFLKLELEDAPLEEIPATIITLNDFLRDSLEKSEVAEKQLFKKLSFNASPNSKNLQRVHVAQSANQNMRLISGYFWVKQYIESMQTLLSNPREGKPDSSMEINTLTHAEPGIANGLTLDSDGKTQVLQVQATFQKSDSLIPSLQKGYWRSFQAYIPLIDTAESSMDFKTQPQTLHMVSSKRAATDALTGPKSPYSQLWDNKKQPIYIQDNDFLSLAEEPVAGLIAGAVISKLKSSPLLENLFILADVSEGGELVANPFLFNLLTTFESNETPIIFSSINNLNTICQLPVESLLNMIIYTDNQIQGLETLTNLDATHE